MRDRSISDSSITPHEIPTCRIRYSKCVRYSKNKRNKNSLTASGDGFLYTGETYEFASPYTWELKRYECDGNGVLEDGEYEGYEWAEFGECYDGSCDPDDREGTFVLLLR